MCAFLKLLSIEIRTFQTGSSLTHRPPSTTIVPYANSLDLDETASNSASHQYPSCLTLRQHFHQRWAILKHFEYWSRRDNLFGGLRVNTGQKQCRKLQFTVLSNHQSVVTIMFASINYGLLKQVTVITKQRFTAQVSPIYLQLEKASILQSLAKPSYMYM